MSEKTAKPPVSPSKKLMKGVQTKQIAPKAAAAPAPKADTKQEPVAATTAAPKADTSEAQTLGGEDLIIQTAKEIETLKEDKAFQLVPKLLDNIDHDYFRLGGVLSVIQTGGWYMDKGFDNFKAYVESECGLLYRKAMYLIKIYNGLVESGVAWVQVKHLGWTKLKELADILTTENVAEWVALAENMTVLQLQAHIKAATAGIAKGESADPGTPDAAAAAKTTTMTFKLHEDQKQTIREALDKCKHESGTDVDTVALENICLNYLGGESKLAKVPTLQELMQGKSVEEVLAAVGETFPTLTMSVEMSQS